MQTCYLQPYPCIDKAVSLYYYTASWHILTRMNKTIYKHGVSHNISMKCDKKYDKRWLKMLLYDSKDYNTKALRQIESIKDVYAVNVWLP